MEATGGALRETFNKPLELVSVKLVPVIVFPWRIQTKNCSNPVTQIQQRVSISLIRHNISASTTMISADIRDLLTRTFVFIFAGPHSIKCSVGHRGVTTAGKTVEESTAGVFYCLDKND